MWVRVCWRFGEAEINGEIVEMLPSRQAGLRSESMPVAECGSISSSWMTPVSFLFDPTSTRLPGAGLKRRFHGEKAAGIELEGQASGMTWQLRCAGAAPALRSAPEKLLDGLRAEE